MEVGSGGPTVGEVTCGGSPHISYKRDQIKMRDYMDRLVTSPTWGHPSPCKQDLNTPVTVNTVLFRNTFTQTIIMYSDLLRTDSWVQTFHKHSTDS